MKWLRIIPLAFDVAKLVEAQVPLSGQGQAKLAFAVDVSREIFAAEEDVRKAWGNPEVFAEALVKAIGLVVSLLNATGVFRKEQTSGGMV